MTAENDIFAFFDRKLNFTKKDEQLQAYLAIDSKEALHIDTKHQSAYNAFPIHYACLYNSKKYFANPKLPHSQIDIPGGTYGSTPMMFTIYNSSYKLLLSLLLNGADISKRNTRSSDVLSFCVRFDDVLGLILVLSFMDKEVNVKRYLKYARIKKAVETRDFLINRRLELEGKNDDINNGFLSVYFIRDNIISLYSWLCFIGMLIYLSTFDLFPMSFTSCYIHFFLLHIFH